MGYITNFVLSASLVLIPVFNPAPTIIYQATAETPLRTAEFSPKLPPEQRLPPHPTKDQLALIHSKAEQYSVSAEVMKTVIACESGYNPNALGDSGYSRGLVQIHSKYHPLVTDEMAYNEEFSIDFLADKLSKNQGSLWTCYRMFYSNRST